MPGRFCNPDCICKRHKDKRCIEGCMCLRHVNSGNPNPFINGNSPEALKSRTQAHNSTRGQTRTEEQRKRISLSQMGHAPTKGFTGKHHSIQEKKKISEASKRNWQDPEYRQKQIDQARENWKNPEYRLKISRGLKQAWRDGKMTYGSEFPNKLELAALEIFSPLGFKYVGNGQLRIGGKCPDFWNGKDKLIEMYGNYWHRNDNPQERIDLFKKQGYDCIVIWESEFHANTDQVLQRVKEFSEV